MRLPAAGCTDVNDAFCSLAKAQAILALVIELARRMTKLVSEGYRSQPCSRRRRSRR
jgi:hypothetical protein